MRATHGVRWVAVALGLALRSGLVLAEQGVAEPLVVAVWHLESSAWEQRVQGQLGDLESVRTLFRSSAALARASSAEQEVLLAAELGRQQGAQLAVWLCHASLGTAARQQVPVEGRSLCTWHAARPEEVTRRSLAEQRQATSVDPAPAEDTSFLEVAALAVRSEVRAKLLADSARREAALTPSASTPAAVTAEEVTGWQWALGAQTSVWAGGSSLPTGGALGGWASLGRGRWELSVTAQSAGWRSMDLPGVKLQRRGWSVQLGGAGWLAQGPWGAWGLRYAVGLEQLTRNTLSKQPDAYATVSRTQRYVTVGAFAGCDWNVSEHAVLGTAMGLQWLSAPPRYRVQIVSGDDALHRTKAVRPVATLRYGYRW